MTLRLVKPAPPKPRRVRRHQLTDAEVKRLGVATRNLIRAYGSTKCLAEVTGLSIDTLLHAGSIGRKRCGMPTAAKIAKAAGMTVEQLLAGRLAEVGTCPTCGADRRAA